MNIQGTGICGGPLTPEYISKMFTTAWNLVGRISVESTHRIYHHVHHFFAGRWFVWTCAAQMLGPISHVYINWFQSPFLTSFLVPASWIALEKLGIMESANPLAPLFGTVYGPMYFSAVMSTAFYGVTCMQTWVPLHCTKVYWSDNLGRFYYYVQYDPCLGLSSVPHEFVLAIKMTLRA